MSVVYVAAAAAVLARGNSSNIYNYSSNNNSTGVSLTPRRVQQFSSVSPPLNWYDSQKRRDWNPFKQYLKIHYPNLTLSHCRGKHVVEYLRYLDKDKPKMHYETCAYFRNSHPPAGPCPCPPKQTWASLDALIGRLRATFHEEHGGSPKMNPFGAPAVRLYLREMRDAEAKAREIAYGKMTAIQNRKPQKSAMKRLFCSCF